MSLLSDKYTVATFDRRQMSASLPLNGGPNKIWNPVQQARDIIAVITALGFEKASVFASSGGCTNALQLAFSYRTYITHLILHEPPVYTLLDPDEATRNIEWAYEVMEKYQKHGVETAMEMVLEILVGYDDGVPRAQPERWNQVNQLENETPWMAIYVPDLVTVKKHLEEEGRSVTVAYGTKSLDAVYVRTAKKLAERLECAFVEFPGHHQGFECEPGAFEPVLREVLEGGRKGKV